MLHAVNPLSTIFASIRVGVGSLTMFLVETIVAFIFASILPNIMSMAMHDTILEATLEIAAISPLEASCATHFIVCPVSCILRAICPEVNAFTLLDTILEVAMVVAAVRPNLDSLTVLLVLSGDFRL